MGDTKTWASNFECWGPTNTHVERQSIFCELCGCNKPLENHELWCPNEPDRAAKDDTDFWCGLGTGPNQFWYDEEADVCDCGDCDELYDEDLTSDEISEWLEDGGTQEDWTMRARCLGIEENQEGLGAYFIHSDGVYQDGVKISSTPQLLGVGGAPIRATTLPLSATERKQYPVASGVLDYFPDALVAISYLSNKGNDQHNPGSPLHWDRSKSGDEADTMIRHFLQRGSLDTDGVRHSVKMAWRALALLQKELEQEGQ